MNKPYLIAEIGINHNGDLNITKKLIDNAKDCGFNCVKFQKRTIDIVYDKNTLDLPNSSNVLSYFDPDFWALLAKTSGFLA